MRRDLVTAFLIVISATTAVAVVPQLFKGGPKHVKHEDDTPTIKIELPPPPPPEEPDQVKDLDADTPQMQMPTLVDMPTTVPVDAFTTPIEPPPPPTLNVGASINVPVSHNDLKGAKIFNLSDLDQAPEARFQPEPQYPFEMKRAGIEGAVNVGLVCDPQGNVVSVYVITSSGQHDLDQSALQAVAKWRFKAGKKGGQPVSVRMTELITFNLDDK
jgi:periplasmic protein TonB